MTIALIPILVASLCAAPPDYGNLDYGNFYETSPIPEMEGGTACKVYVDPGEKHYIEEAGIPIVTEMGETTGRPMDYYYADDSTGIIRAVKPIHGDVDSLIYMVGQLENEFEECYPNRSHSEIVNTVLGYVRGVNAKYTGSSDLKGRLFDVFCGPVDYFANRVVGWNETHVLNFVDFFSSFAPSEEHYNTVGYPKRSTPGFPAGSKMVDPIDTNGRIDVPHMFAVADACYGMTGGTKALRDSNHLLSWAGDLQTFAKDYDDETEKNKYPLQAFEQIMAYPQSYFPYEDLTADMDGYNVGTKLNKGKTVYDSMVSYYASEPFTDEYRFKTFVMSFGNTEEEASWPFQSKVYEMMHLTASQSGSVKESKDGTAAKYELMMKKVSLLSVDTSNLPSYEIRVKCAKLFSEYVLEHAGLPFVEVLP